MNIKQKLGLRINFLSADTLEKLLTTLDVTVQEFFDFEHLKDSSDLLNDIYFYLENLDNDRLVILHKIIQSIAKP